ncbi:MAG: nucleotidyltransferase domain-containing protein [Caldilineaceae bacterium]|nr:nucleotidyltransferase domain-containing protein [Caldilineaceae bacterium]
MNKFSDAGLRDRLAQRIRERDHLLARATEMVADDARVVAAWLFGSLGRGDADALSDIDLFVVVDDAHFDAIRAHRYANMAQLDDPLLILEAPQNWPPGGVYNMAIYAGSQGPHQVDWYWVRKSAAAVPTETKVLFDRARLPRLDTPPHFDYQPVPPRPPIEVATQQLNMFWAMLLITAKYVARSPYDEVLKPPVDSLRAVCEFAGIAPPALLDAQPNPANPLARLAHLRGLAAAADTLTPAMQARAVRTPRAMAAAAEAYLRLIDAIVRATPPNLPADEAATR